MYLAIFVFTVIPLSMVIIASCMHSGGVLRDSTYDQLQTALETNLVELADRIQEITDRFTLPEIA